MKQILMAALVILVVIGGGFVTLGAVAEPVIASCEDPSTPTCEELCILDPSDPTCDENGTGQ